MSLHKAFKCHLIFDMSSILHPYFHALKKEGIEFMPIIYYRFFDAAYWIQQQWNTPFVYFVFDDWTIREKMFPEYKADRKLLKDAMTDEEKATKRIFNKGIEFLRKVILKQRLGFKNVFRQEGFEADDIIGYLVKEKLGKVEKKVIVSGDGDMIQLLDSFTYIHNMKKRETMSKKVFRKRNNIDPKYWNIVQAMVGKNNIPGIVGVGKKRAIAYLNKEFEDRSTTIKLLIKGSKKIIDRNLKLLTLPLDHPDLDYSFLDKNRTDETSPEKWKDFCKEFDLHKLEHRMLKGNNYG